MPQKNPQCNQVKIFSNLNMLGTREEPLILRRLLRFQLLKKEAPCRHNTEPFLKCQANVEFGDW
jgi:hypothetical protein